MLVLILAMVVDRRGRKNVEKHLKQKTTCARKVFRLDFHGFVFLPSQAHLAHASWHILNNIWLLTSRGKFHNDGGGSSAARRR
jgi:hypothetical protein